ncbi:hypothetical protein HanIR_Chr17g0888051 [Helianthus annuus]|nr:hypothetical protein HanIR_Chr17g0888051 [Helianthus annuus]
MRLEDRRHGGSNRLIPWVILYSFLVLDVTSAENGSSKPDPDGKNWTLLKFNKNKNLIFFIISNIFII